MRVRLDPRLLIVVAAVAGNPANARFAPPEGQQFRHIVAEERSGDGAPLQRFETERRLLFTATPEGFLLDMTTVRIGQPPGDAGAMFAAGMAALRGRTIRYRLDHDGRVTAIDDEVAIWTALCDAIDAMARGPASLTPGRQASVRALAAPFRALPADRRRAALISMIAPAIAGPLADKAPGADRAVMIPARGTTGAPVQLAGRERVRLTGDRRLTIETTADGDLPLPGDTSGPPAHVTIAGEKHIDRTSGLVVASRETRDTAIGEAAAQRRYRIVTITTLEPVVS